MPLPERRANGEWYVRGHACLNNGGSSKDITSACERLELLKTLGFADNNKCTRQRATQINMKLAKFFHYNAFPFNLMESEDFADFVRDFCPAYYQQGILGRF
jgi:hypothetical protein